MDHPFYYELIGYAASVLIAVSLMMSALIKLRIINLIGAATFAVYGVLIGSVPVSVMNSFIVLINAYYLLIMYRAKEFFQLLQVPPDSPYLHHFLRFYERQIRLFQPAFDFQKDDDWIPVFILRNMIPAGLILGTRIEGDRLRIELDFAIPKYRDFKIAHYLFCRKKDFFFSKGFRRIESPKGNDTHNAYLERIGFQPDPDNDTRYALDLSPAPEPRAR